jgi:signal transduction histidine kinase
VVLDTKNYKEDKIDSGIKLMFYRIVQEQLNNIFKHANASQVSIQITTTNESTILAIRDNGKGFDTSKTRGGIGLRNISNRAKFYDGSTKVISFPGKGCTLEVIIPLQKQLS